MIEELDVILPKLQDTLDHLEDNEITPEFITNQVLKSDYPQLGEK